MYLFAVQHFTFHAPITQLHIKRIIGVFPEAVGRQGLQARTDASAAEGRPPHISSPPRFRRFAPKGIPSPHISSPPRFRRFAPASVSPSPEGRGFGRG